MKQLRLFQLDGVTGGDTYEIAYAHSYPEKHWSEDSLYFTDDEYGVNILSPYLQRVFPDYAYYGPQKVAVSEWNEVEKLCLADNKENTSVYHFFAEIKEWLERGNMGADYFWILGI
ncbi:MAG TPA: hypothetical protein DD738_11475 [Ruminiclostridium sp.]|nr:hypothetical protein [Ruminiclostridium sp.]